MRSAVSLFSARSSDINEMMMLFDVVRSLFNYVHFVVVLLFVRFLRLTWWPAHLGFTFAELTSNW
jgi:hypothetical protein